MWWEKGANIMRIMFNEIVKWVILNKCVYFVLLRKVKSEIEIENMRMFGSERRQSCIKRWNSLTSGNKHSTATTILCPSIGFYCMSPVLTLVSKYAIRLRSKKCHLTKTLLWNIDRDMMLFNNNRISCRFISNTLLYLRVPQTNPNDKYTTLVVSSLAIPMYLSLFLLDWWKCDRIEYYYSGAIRWSLVWLTWCSMPWKLCVWK